MTLPGMFSHPATELRPKCAGNGRQVVARPSKRVNLLESGFLNCVICAYHVKIPPRRYFARAQGKLFSKATRVDTFQASQQRTTPDMGQSSASSGLCNERSRAVTQLYVD